MGIVLGVPYEAYSRVSLPLQTHPYCKGNPLVYFELGFATGVPLVRLEIALNAPEKDAVIRNFVALCKGSTSYQPNGKKLSYRGSPINFIDSLQGAVVLGGTLPALGYSNGFAATDSGTVKGTVGISSQKPAGCVVMLPRDTDANFFSSVFYVTTQPATINDGKIIGTVTSGLEDLCDMVEQFGSKSGDLKKPMFVHDCGQI